MSEAPFAPRATPPTLDALCRRLDWDSAFFGLPIARILPSRLSRADCDAAVAWCEEQDVACTYFLADARDASTVRIVEDARFRQTDVRITLERTAAPAGVPETGKTAVPIRRHRPGDLPTLRAIASQSHRDSRFYADPGFPKDRVDALYAAWIERDCANDAGAVFVPELGGQPAGYISCHLSGVGIGQMDLLAVGENARGGGVGRGLVDAALSWLHGRGVERVTVVTQGRNFSAQRLYQRAGFVTRSVELWYHRWQSQKPERATAGR